MNVYDRHQQRQYQTSRLLKSKKMSKSSEEANRLVEQENLQHPTKIEPVTKFDGKSKPPAAAPETVVAGQRKEHIEMPMKISSLNVVRREQRDDGQRKVELRAGNIDYAQTDENETLQDISTSFSEEKFDSLPEQMNSEAIRKQFHEAFKSMSIVNEEASDQDSSLTAEDKKTEIEKVTTKIAVQQVNQTVKAEVKSDDLAKQRDKQDSLVKQESLQKQESLVKQASLGKQQSEESKEGDKMTLKASFQQVKHISQTMNAFRDSTKKDEEKLSLKASFQQVNTINQTVAAFKDSQPDEVRQSSELPIKKDETANLENTIQPEDQSRQSVLVRQEEFRKPDELARKKVDERQVDENNNEILKELGDIIISNVTNVQKMFTSNLIKKEQSELINKGWVLVESIKEIDEKEDELRREETTISSSEEPPKKHAKDGLQKEDSKGSKQESKESIKKQDSKGSLKTQDSKDSRELTKKQDSKESIKTQGSKESVKRQESKESRESVLRKADSVERQESSDKISLKDKVVKVEKQPDPAKEQPAKKTESKSLEKLKSKSEDSSDRVKPKKSLSTFSSTSSLEIKRDSKIPKLGKSIKLSSTSSSSTSTPSKKSICSSKSSSSSSKSSPIKKSKTFVVQTAIEEADRKTMEGKTTESRTSGDSKTAQIENQKSLDKVIIFEEESVPISRVDELKAADLLGDQPKGPKKEEQVDQTNEIKPPVQKGDRKLSVVCFPQMGSLDVEKEGKKRYVKTPIKQMSFEEREDPSEKLNDEELSVPSDDKDDDSSPQSLNEELINEQMRKEKNDLIENIEKKLREESIKQIKRVEETAVRRVVSEEQKALSEVDSSEKLLNEKVLSENVLSEQKTVDGQKAGDKQKMSKEQTSEQPKVIKQESKSEQKSERKSESKDEKKEKAKREIKFESTEKEAQKIKEHQKSLSKEEKLEKKDSKSEIKEEDKKDEKLAKADSKSEIIYKSSADVDDLSERTAYIENMLRTSGYTEKIIEKASEFINGQDGEKNKEEGVVEEVTVKLVKKNSKDYYNGKQQANDQTGDKASKAADKKDAKAGGQSTGNQSNVNQSNASQTHVSKSFSQRTSFNQQSSTSQQSSSFNKQTSLKIAKSQQPTEKPASQLKKSPSLSRIPTLQSTKTRKVEISSKFLKDEPTPADQSSSFKRNCLKPLQTKPEPIEQAMNRPVFKRKKSDLPPKHSIQLDNQQIKQKWNDIKTNEKDRLQQERYYSRLRRTTSNPVISNSFDLIYELNKMPQWAKEGVASQQQPRSNTTSIITQTRRVLEKIEKKEIEEVTTRTIINDEESITRTSREESNTHRSETEETESSITGKQCSVCKKIIIPISEDMKFCKRDLRKMLSDSALDVKTCRC